VAVRHVVSAASRTTCGGRGPRRAAVGAAASHQARWGSVTNQLRL